MADPRFARRSSAPNQAPCRPAPPWRLAGHNRRPRLQKPPRLAYGVIGRWNVRNDEAGSARVDVGLEALARLLGRAGSDGGETLHQGVGHRSDRGPEACPSILFPNLRRLLGESHLADHVAI